jgi:hypothetical protein
VVKRIYEVVEKGLARYKVGLIERQMIMGFLNLARPAGEKNEAALVEAIREFESVQLPALIGYIVHGDR